MRLPLDIEKYIVTFDPHWKLHFSNKVLPQLACSVKTCSALHVCDESCGGIILGFMGCARCWCYDDDAFWDGEEFDNRAWRRREVREDGSIVHSSSDIDAMMLGIK